MNFSGWILFSLVVVTLAKEENARKRKRSGDISFGGTGSTCQCIKLTDCKAYVPFARNPTRANIERLKKVTCGFERSTPKVCCPLSTVSNPEPPSTNRNPDPTPTDRNPDPTPTDRNPDPPTRNSPDPLEKCGVGGFSLTRVVGGAPADLGDWPWAVAIFADNINGIPELSCGGSIINHLYILTAAHCIVTPGKRVEASTLTVRVGDLDLASSEDGASPKTHRVAKAIPHANFNLSNFHNDIALLRLEKPIVYTDLIRPICLPSSEDVSNEESFEKMGSVLVGWGTIGFDKEAANHLQYIQISIQTQAICVRAYSPFRFSHPIIKSQMCAGSLSGKKDACQGDSGGPLVVIDPKDTSKWVQVGIVSFGFKCAEPGFPGIYTRTTAFMNWIHEHASL